MPGALILLITIHCHAYDENWRGEVHRLRSPPPLPDHNRRLGALHFTPPHALPSALRQTRICICICICICAQAPSQTHIFHGRPHVQPHHESACCTLQTASALPIPSTRKQPESGANHRRPAHIVIVRPDRIVKLGMIQLRLHSFANDAESSERVASAVIRPNRLCMYAKRLACRSCSQVDEARTAVDKRLGTLLAAENPKSSLSVHRLIGLTVVR